MGLAVLTPKDLVGVEVGIIDEPHPGRFEWPRAKLLGRIPLCVVTWYHQEYALLDRSSLLAVHFEQPALSLGLRSGFSRLELC